LHGVFSVFAVTADGHAERKHRILEKFQRPFRVYRIAGSQQLERFYEI
jgi:hypothetical protein